MGLSNISKALLLFDDPQLAWPAIHIAGTNGKGSVSWKLAKAFQLSNIRCGLFTSPHLSSFRERVQIDFNPIPEGFCASLLESIHKKMAAAGLKLTFFEMATLLAFIYFREEKVDVAVIEAGLGGLLDTTNVLKPLLSVITSISYDHTAILGETLGEIAAQKGGIIKPRVPVVIGPSAAFPEILQLARQNESPLIQVLGNFSDYSQENRAVAEACLKELQAHFHFTQVESALDALPPCRFEKVPIEVLRHGAFASFPEACVILDVAHNPSGIAKLIGKLNLEYPGAPHHFLVNFSAHKDVRGMMALLQQAAASLTVIQSSHPRLMHSSHLQALGSSPEPSLPPKEALKSALKRGGVVVICGSFFIMQEVRSLLGYQEDSDSGIWQERL
ncbi:MAG: putative folylpolyglutamate synthase [Chlamydiales bacterium]|nr:putative folylpolyglutamate synthase [Chlamydiales bacterium]